MLKGGQVYLGGYLAILGLRTHRGLPPAGHLLRSPSGGTRAWAPAVPPSLAVRCRTAPSLGSRCRFYSPWGPRPVGGAHCPMLSSGGSGVIFASCTPPGSHRPRVAAGCVRRYSSHQCLSLRPVYGAAPTAADRISSAGTGPGAERRTGWSGWSPRRVPAPRDDPNAAVRLPLPRADSPGGGAGTTQANRTSGPGAGVRRAVRPVAAWRWAIYRSRHDSRTKSHM